MMKVFLYCISLLVLMPVLSAQRLLMAELKPPTWQAFDVYARERELAMDAHLKVRGPFWLGQDASRIDRARSGEIVIDAIPQDNPVHIPDGLVHDWVGGAFIPGATVDTVLAFVQNYDNHKNVYKPEVVESKLLARNGNDFKVFLRLRKKKVITVVLNTEHDVKYHRIDSKQWHSRSHSTRIAEVDDPGKKSEREFVPGMDHGFLWKIYSYWWFVERDGGVYIECEAISLTRGIPAGTGWLVEPVVRELPEESLRQTLAATRDALRK
jgi:hypothetical protein